jgi:hypothetical protein
VHYIITEHQCEASYQQKIVLQKKNMHGQEKLVPHEEIEGECVCFFDLYEFIHAETYFILCCVMVVGPALGLGPLLG